MVCAIVVSMATGVNTVTNHAAKDVIIQHVIERMEGVQRVVPPVSMVTCVIQDCVLK